jgi:retinoblastoma-like protein 1
MKELDVSLRGIVVEKLNLREDSATAQAAQHLIEECLPELLKATTTTDPPSSSGSASAKAKLAVDSAQEKSLKLWRACFLYIAKRVKFNTNETNNNNNNNDSNKVFFVSPEERSFTISQLLRACNVSFVEFAREMRHVLARVKPRIEAATGSSSAAAGGKSHPTLESALEMSELSMDFCHISVLFSKYKDKFQHLFTSGTGKNNTTGGTSGLGLQDPVTTGGQGSDWEADPWFKLGWLAFITCKSKLLPQFADLVSCASLLVCVLNFLLAHMPPSRLRKPLNDPQAYTIRTATGATYTLGCVAFLMHAHLQDAQKLMPRVDDLLNELLSRDPVIERFEAVVDAVIMTGCGNYKGLLAVGAQERQLEIMDKAYDQAYRLDAEVDARDFAQSATSRAMGNSNKMTPRLNKRSPLIAPLKNVGGIPLKENRSWPSPFRRPSSSVHQSPALLNRVAPPTPISEALAASKWLRNAVSQHMAGTSKELERIFALCNNKNNSDKKGDIREKINKFVLELADKVLPAVGSPLGKRKVMGNPFSSEAEKRKKEGIALYYHILEAMLLAEERRTGPEVLMPLLLNKELHVSMAAFAFEVLADCYKMTALSFPTVLNRLDISAFDLCKVIEPLVRSEVNLNLPKEVKRHLYAIEENSLELLSWKPGSTFYKHMITARSNTSQGDNNNGENRNNNNSTSSSAFEKVTPLPKFFGKPQNRNNSQTSSHTSGSGNTSSSSPSEKTLEEFFKKVAKLCTFRLIDLCNRLERDCLFKKKDGELVDAGLILEDVISIVEYVIYDQTRLLYNRHVDQIILSSLYGVCKVHQIGVTFREIVHHYSKQTQCKQEVYRAVVLSQTYPELQVEETGDIILFYNRVFVRVVQNELLNLLSNTNASANTTATVATVSGAGAGAGVGVGGLRLRTNGRSGSPATTTGSTGNGDESPKTPTMGGGPSVYPKFKKVADNVFATRLPDYKKQEYLLASPSSHSLFTFIGTSPEDNETPSKRWATINNKLNRAAGAAAAAADLESQVSVNKRMRVHAPATSK